jgi:hypothetical protein
VLVVRSIRTPIPWRKTRRNLVTDVVQRKTSDTSDGTRSREFELLVGNGFRLQDYPACRGTRLVD